MPFSKFDPHRPAEPAPAAVGLGGSSAARRAWILRWGTRLMWAQVVLGTLLMLYWWNRA